MKETYSAKLWVNGKPIAINRFVEQFMSHTTVGAVTSLKGGQSIHKLDIHQKNGNVEIKVNDTEVPLTAFPNDIISNTLLGMASSLKDVAAIDSIDISVEVS
jgi:hypothetical protein